MTNIYDEFYEQYIPELKSKLDEFPSFVRNIPNHRKKKSYIGFSAGKSGIQYYSEYTGRGYLGGHNKGYIVGLYIDGTNYKEKLDYFTQFKSNLDDSLIWLDTGRAGRVFYRLSGLIDDKSAWQNVIDWQIEKLIKVMNEFHPYIEKYQPIRTETNPNSTTIRKIEESKMNDNSTLNQILYGPPGTGKTYNTINKALKIIDGKVSKNRSEAKARFEELSSSGQIEFVTFHQSYGYEEFVEGIKANSVNGEISYDVEDGIFKKLSKLALNKNYKITAEKILEKAIQNVKALSFTTTRGVVDVSLKDNGSFEFSNHHNMTRNNVIKSLNIFLNSKNINEITPDSLMDIGANGHRYTRYLFTKRLYELYATESKNLANHILIIDEINRGNISKIFGELITLIEPSKRIGASEEIRLRSPYSNEPFGVPSNLYILGTMNTADRSIALMDTALRRRFEFVEMMPDAELLDFEIEGVHLKSLLQTINARVEYLYDRDHTIGHAYFMELDESSSLAELNAVMLHKIIPLLQEYFYDDWEKIKLVLNDGFIHSSKVDAQTVFESIDDEYIEDEKLIYSILDEFEKEAYLRLCQTR